MRPTLALFGLVIALPVGVLLWVIARRKLADRWQRLQLDYHTLTQNHAAAIPIARKALNTALSRYGAQHRETAAAQAHLGGLLFLHGKRDEGTELVQQAAAFFDSFAGPPDDDFAIHWMNLGIAQYQVEDKPAAIATLRRVIDLTRRLRGADHERVAEVASNLGAMLDETGAAAEAIPFNEEAVRIRAQVHGADSYETAKARNNLAASLTSAGRYAEAETELRRAIPTLEKVADHAVANAYGTYADLLIKQEKLAEAERLRSQSLIAFQRALGEKHVEVAKSMDEYAALLDRLDRRAEAGLFRDKAKNIREELPC